MDEVGVKNTKLLVLLVEDNPVNQKLVERYLLKIGHQIDIADNGEIGLEFLAKKKYDVILMDIEMPVLNGIEATKKILEIYSDDRPVIIAVTASILSGYKEICIQAGMDDYMEKPFSAEQLKRMFEKWADKIKKRRDANYKK
jgi:CheY-like chemotaxis protein